VPTCRGFAAASSSSGAAATNDAAKADARFRPAADRLHAFPVSSVAMSYARVTLLPSQQVLTVSQDETVLDAALRAGLNLPHSCKGGHCAACRARIVEGRTHYPDGRPVGITEVEERAGYTLLCEAHALSDLVVEIRQIERADEIQIRSLPCRIEHVEPLAPDVMQVLLRLPAVEQFNFAAGQYIDIMLPGSRRRSFSLANPPHDARLLELHIRKVRGGEFTEQLFAGMREKTLLRIEGPLGQFWFRETSPRPAILIGGGTGYAPVRAMLRHLLERGDQRPLHFYWGAQDRRDLYEEARVLGWTRDYPNLEFVPVLSAAESGTQWTGRTGFVHTAVLADFPRLEGYDVYAAGPPAMIEAIRAEFPERGLPPEQLFFDSFDFAPDVLAKLRAVHGHDPL
jgi:CDP-4-dehydro-6-deoxyglucose reductase